MGSTPSKPDRSPACRCPKHQKTTQRDQSERAAFSFPIQRHVSKKETDDRPIFVELEQEKSTFSSEMRREAREPVHEFGRVERVLGDDKEASAWPCLIL